MKFYNICRNKGIIFLEIYNKVYENNDHVKYIQKCTTNFKYYAKTDLIYARNYSLFSVEVMFF